MSFSRVSALFLWAMYISQACFVRRFTFSFHLSHIGGITQTQEARVKRSSADEYTSFSP